MYQGVTLKKSENIFINHVLLVCQNVNLYVNGKTTKERLLTSQKFYDILAERFLGEERIWKV